MPAFPPTSLPPPHPISTRKPPQARRKTLWPICAGRRPAPPENRDTAGTPTALENTP